MRVLVDTNIILDDFLEREPFVEDAAITRNPQDFAGATLPILSASELLESLS